MKRLLVLSGKGGTGKTTVASYLIDRLEAKAYCDCDVDAPNLHLVVGCDEDEPIVSTFYGSAKASVDDEKCTGCRECLMACAFGAVSIENGKARMGEFSCEGCGACAYVCPSDAVSMDPDKAGRMMLYRSYDTVFSTAELKMGRGNSGKLVSEVKKAMNESAYEDTEIAVIDGSPGIGCPVISSISGTDMVIAVTEPSVSGLHDLERLVRTARVFGVKFAVIINKADLSNGISDEIETYAKCVRIPVIGRIPYDTAVVKAVNSNRSVFGTGSAAEKALEEAYENAMRLLASEHEEDRNK